MSPEEICSRCKIHTSIGDPHEHGDFPDFRKLCVGCAIDSLRISRVDLPEVQQKILEVLHETHDSITRGRLVELLDIPRSTIHDNIEKLRDLGLIKKVSLRTSARGRPFVGYRLTE